MEFRVLFLFTWPRFEQTVEFPVICDAMMPIWRHPDVTPKWKLQYSWFLVQILEFRLDNINLGLSFIGVCATCATKTHMHFRDLFCLEYSIVHGALTVLFTHVLQSYRLEQAYDCLGIRGEILEIMT